MGGAWHFGCGGDISFSEIKVPLKECFQRAPYVKYQQDEDITFIREQLETVNDNTVEWEVPNDRACQSSRPKPIATIAALEGEVEVVEVMGPVEAVVDRVVEANVAAVKANVAAVKANVAVVKANVAADVVVDMAPDEMGRLNETMQQRLVRRGNVPLNPMVVLIRRAKAYNYESGWRVSKGEMALAFEHYKSGCGVDSQMRNKGQGANFVTYSRCVEGIEGQLGEAFKFAAEETFKGEMALAFEHYKSGCGVDSQMHNRGQGANFVTYSRCVEGYQEAMCQGCEVSNICVMTSSWG
ncbi:hypothetical protein BU17DRAFT_72459 [Hysterangium stoloniferum]|nr:hypothetical protein BU17DRAFT_72459 [Hysterangium stoloniferum]